MSQSLAPAATAARPVAELALTGPLLHDVLMAAQPASTRPRARADPARRKDRLRFLIAVSGADGQLRNARQANAMAMRLSDGLKAVPGIGLSATPQANIVFCRLPQQAVEGLLAEGYTFHHGRWGHGVVRLVTAFSHTPDDIDGFLDAIRRHAG
ncbi:hypothetical protein [Streptomyces soliscabiei]|uniref:hypothetical protein n=1 Tax=Streptomyces soliscabiei TaxID=588897 RepID=UPI0029BF21F1|nr:hypothetical protein [Streptomyces sp. NY05-11A]MDX2682983.1 hypothetical protein [Streptomyces sp. NY05-11A]